jgi:hypothetical protein
MTHLKAKLAAAATALIMFCSVISYAEMATDQTDVSDEGEISNIDAPDASVKDDMAEAVDDTQAALQKSFMQSISPAIVKRLAEIEEERWYRSKIPMKKEHQKLLWDCCQERNLDYFDMLALISLESNFDEKCVNGTHKGYFQISTANAANLSKTLGTENKPLDGEINIIWGTAYYSWILAEDRVKGLEGKALRDAALSIYQRGSGGYDKYGLSYSFLQKYYKKRDEILEYFK